MPPKDYGQDATSAAIRDLTAQPAGGAPFTYLLTTKQQSVLDSRFTKTLWPKPQCRAVTPSANALAHVAQSRVAKDGMGLQGIAELLVSVFHKDAQVAVNRGRLHQFFLVNARTKHASGQLAIGCFQVLFEQGTSSQTDLVTAYLATPAKARRILGG
jgi:hypothetical protein